MLQDEDVGQYIASLFSAPEPTLAPREATRRYRLDPEDMECVATGDADLKARFLAYCRDIGLSRSQARAALGAMPGRIDMQGFRSAIASVAVVAAPRLSEEARRNEIVKEVTWAIASTAGVPTVKERQRVRRNVGSSS